MSAGQGPDDPPRMPPRQPSRPAAQRARGVAGGIGAAWRGLSADQRLAAIAAVALLLSMLLPWYQETGNALVNNRLVRLADSKNAFQVYSFVEAAIFVVSAGVIALLYARGHRRAFHLPGGDGTVIMAAGLWVMFLVFYRQLDKPNGRSEGPINTSIGVEWGIFVAFLLGAVLAYAGYRIRAAHTPEPVVDEEPPAAAAPAPAAHDAATPTPPAPAPPSGPTTDPAPGRGGAEPPPTTERPRPGRDDDDPFDADFSFDEPAEYRPPPRPR